MSQNTFAESVWVNNPTFHYWTLTYNEGLSGNGIIRYESDGTPPFNLMARPSNYTNYLVGMTVYGIDISGYNYESFTTFYLDFQLRVENGGNKLGYFVNIPPSIKLVVDNYNSYSCNLSSSSEQISYQYHCSISLPENTRPQRLYLDIGEPYSTGLPFSPISAIPSGAPSGAVLKMNYLGFGFDTQANQTNQYLDVLSQQNQTIINQNQTIINNQNQNTEDIIDNQSDNTDAIINNQNDNTDAIIKSNQDCHQSVNLIDGSYEHISQTVRSTSSSSGNGFTITSTSSSGASYVTVPIPDISSLLGKTVTLSYLSSGSGVRTGFFYLNSNGGATGSISYNNTITLPSSLGDNSGIGIVFYTSNNGSATYNDIQIELGSNSTSYEPYGEEICKNFNEQYYDEQRKADQNISNQSSSDIDGAENQATTNLIGVLSGFISAFSNVNATNCNLTLDFPSYAGGTRVVNICSGKEKAPRIVEIGSSLLLIGVFVPLAYILIKMIYNEIRSWTNG